MLWSCGKTPGIVWGYYVVLLFLHFVVLGEDSGDSLGYYVVLIFLHAVVLREDSGDSLGILILRSLAFSSFCSLGGRLWG